MLTNHVPYAANYLYVLDCFRDDIRTLKTTYLHGNLDLLTLYKLDSLTLAIIIALSLALLCLIASIVTKNYSHVDRLWSFLPAYYSFHFIIFSHNELVSARSYIVTALILIWSVRLTYNFYRKGGYSLSEEDYRWAYVRKAINNDFLWLLFNIFFICLFQQILLLLIAIPAYVVEKSDAQDLVILDAIATFLFIIYFIVEVIADEQMWRFQTKKYELINSKKPRKGDYKLGFITHGLFGHSRHPNFFSEMSLWWVVYLFSVASSGVWLNYSIIGTILLTMLITASTHLTESISKGKYPEYGIYQKTTSKFIPWFRGPSVNSMIKKKE